MLYRTDGVQVVEYHAYAKINLALSVLGKREDGYHEIVTLMAPVNISDLVSVEAKPQGLEVFCPDLPGLAQHDNLAYRAAQSFLARQSISCGFRISIQKNIPAGKGLGGGSSDAAAALLAMRDVACNLRGVSLGLLMDMASEIGSDVPFFIGANSKPPLWQAAVCTGRGESIHVVEGGSYWLVLVFPEVKVATKMAYSQWDCLYSGEPPIVPESTGLESALSLDLRMDRVVRALASNDPESLGKNLYNDLEKPVYSCFPELSIIKENLLKSGADGAAMTGSGSAVYGICSSREHGLEVRNKFLNMSRELPVRQAIVTRTGV